MQGAGWVAAWLLAQGAPAPVDAPEPLPLEVRGADECGGSDRLRRTVSNMLADSTRARPVDIDVTLRFTDPAWEVELAIVDDQANEARRTLATETCAAALDAAAVVIALAIDPEADIGGPPEKADDDAQDPSEAPETEDPEAEQPVEETREEPPPDDPRTPPPPPRERPRWAVDVGAGASVGVVTGGAGVLRLSAEGGGRRWSVGGGGTYQLPRRVDLDDDAGARLQLWTADVFGCFVPRPAAAPGLALPVCALAHAGAVHGRGLGARIDATRGASAWVALGVGAKVRWHGRRGIGVFGGIEGLVLARRPTFVLEGVGAVCCDSAIAALGVAGVSFGSPRP